MGSELSVFKGREARLNLALFTALALLGPLNITEIQKHVSRKKGLGRTYYASLTKRIRSLIKDEYIIELQPKKGSRAMTYQITEKAHLAMFFYDHNYQEILDKSDGNDSANLLIALSKIFKKSES
jgi:hypothetical protein